VAGWGQLGGEVKRIPFGSDCALVHVHRLSAVSENTVQVHKMLYNHLSIAYCQRVLKFCMIQ